MSDAAKIGRIARLEKIKAAAAALQAAESGRFAQSQAEMQLAADVHPNKIGRGIADSSVSPAACPAFAAARRLEMARALWCDLPQTYQLLTAGEISDYVASLVAMSGPATRSWRTLVERITGQAQATDVNAELQIAMDLDGLPDANNNKPAELVGSGPLPADLARDILATSKGQLWWRRLYASPAGGPLAGGIRTAAASTAILGS